MRRVFVGREAEVGVIEARLAAAESGDGALALLVGEPGIGKTWLATEMTRRAEERGFRVAWGRAWEAAGAPPFWPWASALRELGLSLPRREEEIDSFDAIVSSVRALPSSARSSSCSTICTTAMPPRSVSSASSRARCAGRASFSSNRRCGLISIDAPRSRCPASLRSPPNTGSQVDDRTTPRRSLVR